MAGLFTSLLFPTQVFTASDNNLICGDENRFSHRKLNSDERDNLCESYSGKVILVVNTASRCAFTGQYEGLANLYSKYRSKGLVVGFPSNNFGRQEPGDEQSIKNFCELTYNVEFPMYSKTRVKGENADPLYLALTSIAGPPRWNFHKYLLDRQGNVVASYGSSIKPDDESLISTIESNL